MRVVQEKARYAQRVVELMVFDEMKGRQDRDTPLPQTSGPGEVFERRLASSHEVCANDVLR
jgi:hypothetical protein